MQKHKFDTRTETKPSLSKQVVERQRDEHEARGARLPQRGPFAPLISGIGDASSAGVHASMLNQTTGGRPSRAGQSLLQLQRQYGNRYVQRMLALAGKGTGEAEVAPEVEQSIQQARGGGHGIDSRVRGQMESAFGADFSNVRLHTDTQADTLNRELNARAFTTGQDIFFRQGASNSGSSSGRELLAHELTHVVQQNGDKVQRKLTVGQPGNKYEQEADQVARAVMQQEQRPVSTGVNQGSVRRQIEEDKEEETIQTKPEDFGVQRQAEGECTSKTSRGNHSLVKELTNVKLQNTSLKVQRENGPAAKKIPAVVTSTDISQEIKIRLDHIATHVDTAISSFENWFNKTSVKVGDLDPFAKFFRGKATSVFGCFLTGPYTAGATLIYEVITTAVDSAIADKIKSIEDFRKNMAARFKEKMTDLTTKKNKEITTEKLGIALSQIDQTKVNVENHVEVVDAVTINYFEVPDYQKIDLWPKIMEKLVEEYLTFYWTKVVSKTKKGIMLAFTPRTFEEEIKHQARESVKIYRMKAMPKDDSRYVAVASFIRASDWNGLLRYTSTLNREDMIAIGLNPEVKELIKNSKMGHIEKAMARGLFFISK